MAGFRSGLFWGALFGGIAGLMNAPQSGRETRQDIKDFIDTTTEDVDDVRYKVDNLRVSLQRLAGEGLDSVKEASQDIQTSLKHFEEENQPRINRIQDRSQQLQTTVEEQARILEEQAKKLGEETNKDSEENNKNNID